MSEAQKVRDFLDDELKKVLAMLHWYDAAIKHEEEIGRAGYSVSRKEDSPYPAMEKLISIATILLDKMALIAEWSEERGIKSEANGALAAAKKCVEE